VTVPYDAIVTFAGIEKVLTVSNNSAVEKRVRTGRRIEDRVEITEGIAIGDEVVVRPGNLVAGEPVQVIR
jgi:multidrug efflux pump subunit AcrA (membrane-fusion protein)